MKILVVRFSSIGDVVLTSPVVRALRNKFPEAEIHYLTKKKFANVMENNPHITHLHAIDKNVDEIISTLTSLKFDVVIDLHHNIRTRKLKKKLGVTSYTFPKLNFKKWLLVNLGINVMPAVHIVDRYFEAVEKLGVVNDKRGLEYFIPPATRLHTEILPASHVSKYVVLVLGAAHYTKTIPRPKLEFICKNIPYPLVLIGGPAEKETGEWLVAQSGSHVHNTAGLLSLHESAQVVKNAAIVITPDTGMMHIAAAFKKPIISVWGNTVPAFGMTPYMPGNESETVIIENNKLRCRPCSKIGYKKCPLGHFKCMNDLDYEKILSVVKQRF